QRMSPTKGAHHDLRWRTGTLPGIGAPRGRGERALQRARKADSRLGGLPTAHTELPDLPAVRRPADGLGTVSRFCGNGAAGGRGDAMSRTYEQELASMPPGLDRAVLRVLNFHRGRERAIGRFPLLAEVKRMGFS